MLSDEQLDKIERRLSNANGLGLDEAVARHYREDVPALLSEVRSFRAQREAVLALCSEYLDGFDASTNHEIRMRNSARAAVASRFREALGVTE